MAFLDDVGLNHFWTKIKAILSTKVDAVTGKGLSTNDFTTDEKTKLDGLKYVTMIESSGPSSDNLAKLYADEDDSNCTYTVIVSKSNVASALSDTFVKKADQVNVMQYKGSVANYAALPTENVNIGDVYDVADSGMNYAWTGEKWDPLGQTFTIEAITTAEIDAMFTQDED